MTNVVTATAGRKGEQILEAAAAIFLSHGYEAATMDQIAARAGVARQTVYNNFQSKDALFRAIVDDLVAQLTGPLTEGAVAGADPRDALMRLGERALEMQLRPDLLALHRIVIAESGRFPELGRSVYEAGPAKAVAALAGYLAAQSRNGKLAVEDPESSAEQFLGMLSGHHQLRALLGVGDGAAPERLRDFVRLAVDNFIRAHAPGR